jgi:hypothetical protein
MRKNDLGRQAPFVLISGPSIPDLNLGAIRFGCRNRILSTLVGKTVVNEGLTAIFQNTKAWYGRRRWGVNFSYVLQANCTKQSLFDGVAE